MLDMFHFRTLCPTSLSLSHFPSTVKRTVRIMSNSVDELPAHDTKHEQQSSEQDPESNISVTSKPEDSAPTPATAAFDPHAFPESGTQAWLTVAGAAAFLFVSFGWINSIGIFQEYYQDSLLKDYTPSQIAWISSLMRMFLTFLSSDDIEAMYTYTR